MEVYWYRNWYFSLRKKAAVFRDFTCDFTK